jgi:hypothetical protein
MCDMFDICAGTAYMLNRCRDVCSLVPVLSRPIMAKGVQLPAMASDSSSTAFPQIIAGTCMQLKVEYLSTHELVALKANLMRILKRQNSHERARDVAKIVADDKKISNTIAEAVSTASYNQLNLSLFDSLDREVLLVHAQRCCRSWCCSCRQK